MYIVGHQWNHLDEPVLVAIKYSRMTRILFSRKALHTLKRHFSGGQKRPRIPVRASENWPLKIGIRIFWAVMDEKFILYKQAISVQGM